MITIHNKFQTKLRSVKTMKMKETDEYLVKPDSLLEISCSSSLEQSVAFFLVRTFLTVFKFFLRIFSTLSEIFDEELEKTSLLTGDFEFSEFIR